MSGTAIPVIIQIIGENSSFTKAGAQTKQQLQEIAKAAQGTTEALQKQAVAAKNAARAADKGTASFGNGKRVAKDLGNSYSALAQTQNFLAQAWNSSSGIIDKKYLSSISGLRQGLTRFNQEAQRTLVMNKGMVTTLDDSSLAMQRYMMKGNLVTRTLDNMASKIISTGKNAQWTGRQLMVGLTAPIAAVGVAADKAGMSVLQADLAIRKLLQSEATNGAGGLEGAMSALDTQSKKLSTTLGSTRLDIKAMQETFASGGFNSADIQQLTQVTTEFQKLGNIDASKAIEMVQVLAKQGYGIDKIRDTLEKLNKMENETALNMNDVVDSFGSIFPIFNQLNTSAPQTIALLAAFKSQGIDVSQGATTLESAISKLPAALSHLDDGTKDGAARLKYLKSTILDLNKATGAGISFLDPTTQRERPALDMLLQIGGAYETLKKQSTGAADEIAANLSRSLFGGSKTNEGVTLLDQLGKAMDKDTKGGQDLAKALAIANGAIGSAAQRWRDQLQTFLNDPSTQQTNAINQLMISLQELGKLIIPIANKILGFVNGLIEKFNGLSESSKKTIMTFVAAIALIGPAVYIAAQGMIAFGTVAKGLIAPFKSIFGMKGAFKDVFDGADEAAAALGKVQDEFRRTGDHDKFINDSNKIISGLDHQKAATERLTTATKAQAAAEGEAATAAATTGGAREARINSFMPKQTATEARGITGMGAIPLNEYDEMKASVRTQKIQELLSQRTQFDVITKSERVAAPGKKTVAKQLQKKIDKAEQMIKAQAERDASLAAAAGIVGPVGDSEKLSAVKAEKERLKSLQARMLSFEKTFGRPAPVVDPEDFNAFEKVLTDQMAQSQKQRVSAHEDRIGNLKGRIAKAAEKDEDDTPAQKKAKKEIEKNLKLELKKLVDSGGPASIAQVVRDMTTSGDIEGIERLFGDALYETRVRQGGALIGAITDPVKAQALVQSMIDDPKLLNAGTADLRDHFVSEIHAGRVPRMPVRQDAKAKTGRKANNKLDTSGLKLAMQDVMQARAAIENGGIALPMTSEIFEEIASAIDAGPDTIKAASRSGELDAKFDTELQEIAEKLQAGESVLPGKTTPYDRTHNVVGPQGKRGSPIRDRERAGRRAAQSARDKIFDAYQNQSVQVDELKSFLDDILPNVEGEGAAQLASIKRNLEEQITGLETHLKSIGPYVKSGLMPSAGSVTGYIETSQKLEKTKADLLQTLEGTKISSRITKALTPISLKDIEKIDIEPFEGGFASALEADTSDKAFHDKLQQIRTLKKKRRAKFTNRNLDTDGLVELTTKEEEQAYKQARRAIYGKSAEVMQRQTARVLEGGTGAVGIGGKIPGADLKLDRRNALNASKKSDALGLKKVRENAEDMLTQLGFTARGTGVGETPTKQARSLAIDEASKLKRAVAFGKVRGGFIHTPEGIFIDTMTKMFGGGQHPSLAETIKGSAEGTIIPPQYREALLDAIWGGEEEGSVSFTHDKQGKKILSVATGYAGKLQAALGNDYSDEHLALLNQIAADVTRKIPDASSRTADTFEQRAKVAHTRHVGPLASNPELHLGERLRRKSGAAPKMNRDYITKQADDMLAEAESEEKILKGKRAHVRGKITAFRKRDAAERDDFDYKIEHTTAARDSALDDLTKTLGPGQAHEIKTKTTQLRKYVRSRAAAVVQQNKVMEEFKTLASEETKLRSFIGTVGEAERETDKTKVIYKLKNLLGMTENVTLDDVPALIALAQEEAAKKAARLDQVSKKKNVKTKRLGAIDEQIKYLSSSIESMSWGDPAFLETALDDTKKKISTTSKALIAIETDMANIEADKAVVVDRQERNQASLARQEDRLSKRMERLETRRGAANKTKSVLGRGTLGRDTAIDARTQELKGMSNLFSLMSGGAMAGDESHIQDLAALESASGPVRGKGGKITSQGTHPSVLVGALSPEMANALSEITITQTTGGLGAKRIGDGFEATGKKNLNAIEAIIERHIPDMDPALRREAAEKADTISRHLRSHLDEAELLLGTGIRSQITDAAAARSKMSLAAGDKNSKEKDIPYDPSVLAGTTTKTVEDAAGAMFDDTETSLHSSSRKSAGGRKANRSEMMIDDQVELSIQRELGDASGRVETTTRALAELETKLQTIEAEERKVVRSAHGKRGAEIKKQAAKLRAEAATAKVELEKAQTELNAILVEAIDVVDGETGVSTHYNSKEEYDKSRRKEIEGLVSEDDIERETRSEIDKTIAQREATIAKEKELARKNAELRAAQAETRAKGNIESLNKQDGYVKRFLLGSKQRAPISEEDEGLLREMHDDQVRRNPNATGRKFNKKDIAKYKKYKSMKEMEALINATTGGGFDIGDDFEDVVPTGRKAKRISKGKKVGVKGILQDVGAVAKEGEKLTVKAAKKGGGSLLEAATWLNPLKGIKAMGGGLSGLTKNLGEMVKQSPMLDAIFPGMAEGMGGLITTAAPFLPIILALAALGAILALNFKKWIAFAQPGIDKLMDAFSTLKDAVLGPILNMFDKLGGKGKDTGAGVGNIWQDIGKVIGKVAEIIAKVVNTIAPVIKFIVQVIVDQLYIFIQIFRAIIAFVTGDFSDFGDALKNIWSGVCDYLKLIFGSAIKAVITIIGSGLSNIITGIRNLVDHLPKSILGISTGVQGIVDALDAASGAIDSLRDNANSAIDGWIGDNGEHAAAAEKTGEDMNQGLQDGLDSKPLDAPAIDPQSAQEAVSKFISAFQNQLQKVVDGWKDAALKAFDDWAKAGTDAIDTQIKAIDDLTAAEKIADEDQQYLRQKEEMRARRRSEMIKYHTDRDLAIYEGRYDDAKQLDYDYSQTLADLQKQEADLDKSRQDQLTGRSRDAAKDRLNIEKDELQKSNDIRRQQLEEQLNMLTEYIPKNVAEAQAMQDAILQAMGDATGRYGVIGDQQQKEWQKGWTTAFSDAQKQVSEEAFWAGQDAMNQFASGLGIDLSTLQEANTSPDDSGGNGMNEQGQLTHPGDSTGAPGNGFNSGGQLTHRHSGGSIGNSNMAPADVPATLQTGEYVIQRSAVAKLGVDAMHSINQGEIPTFHTGGYVDIAHKAMSNKFTNYKDAFLKGGLKIGQRMGADGKATGGFSFEDVQGLYQSAASGFGAVGDMRKAILDFAMDKLGMPYQWGGTGNPSYDCSGLVQAAYAAAGISLPRVDTDQRARATEVLDPLPADFVWHPGHIGLYVGNGKMLDAPHTGAFIRIEDVWPDMTYARVPELGNDSSSSASSGGGLALKKKIKAILGSTSTPAFSGGDAQLKEMVQQSMGNYGWDMNQWNPLDQLIGHESGWNPNATNPSSGAWGLFQFMPMHFRPGGALPNGTSSSIAEQISAGLNYISGRYGNPSSAWDFWQRTDPRPYPGHWYHKGGPVFQIPSLDTGGFIDSDGIAKVHRGERVLNAVQTAASLGDGGGDVNIDLHFEGGFFGSDRELEKLATTLETRIVPKIQRVRGQKTRTFSKVTK